LQIAQGVSSITRCLGESSNTLVDSSGDLATGAGSDGLGGIRNLGGDGINQVGSSGGLSFELAEHSASLLGPCDDVLLGDQVGDGLLGLGDQVLGWGDDGGGPDNIERCGRVNGCDGGVDCAQYLAGLGGESSGCSGGVNAGSEASYANVEAVKSVVDQLELLKEDFLLGKGRAQESEDNEFELHFERV
jgi:hypothetical protein